MKKSIFICLIGILLISSLFAQNKAKMTYLIGDVMIKSPNMRIAEVAKWNMELGEGTLIMTGKESRAEIKLPDNSIIRIGQNSQFKLDKIKAEKGKRSFFMEIIKGGFFSKVSKLFSGDVSVKSPVAVIAIRGTEFAVWSVADSIDEVQVLKGEISIYNSSKSDSSTIYGGHKLQVKQNSPLTDPIPLTYLEKKMLNELSSGENFKAKEIPEPEKIEKIEETESTKDKEIEEKKEVNPFQDTQEESSIEEQSNEDTKSEGLNMGAGVGAVTLDGKTFTQLALRPEFSVGKLGVALDLTLYLDENGKIRKENWDDISDIFEKIYYLRWAQKGDPLYLKLGAITNYTFGYGLVMSNYSNTVEYPAVIRPGIEFGFKSKRFYFEGMVNNIREVANSGGIVALNAKYNPFLKFEIGGGVIMDINQYAGLEDNDNDGAPDVLDDFPTDKKYQVDTDGDGIPDALDPDRDGNGYTDNDPLNNNDVGFNESLLKPQPFNIKNEKDDLMAWSANIAYPIIKSKLVSVIPYAEIAGFKGYGYGYSAPGVMGNISFFKYKAEYRKTEKQFIPSYFNQTYELDRVNMVTDTAGYLQPITKEQALKNSNKALQGYLVGAGFNILDFLDVFAEYQNMQEGSIKYNSLIGHATVNTSFFPKIKQATAYYNQYNVKKIFKPSNGTILGYRLMYEITAGAYLLTDFRQTYRDINGDGKFKGNSEIIKTINVGTYFTF